MLMYRLLYVGGLVIGPSGSSTIDLFTETNYFLYVIKFRSFEFVEFSDCRRIKGKMNCWREKSLQGTIISKSIAARDS